MLNGPDRLNAAEQRRKRAFGHLAKWQWADETLGLESDDW
jgi:hypothetical protein